MTSQHLGNQVTEFFQSPSVTAQLMLYWLAVDDYIDQF